MKKKVENMNNEELFKEYFICVMKQYDGLEEKKIYRSLLDKVREEIVGIRAQNEVYHYTCFMSSLPEILKRVRKNRDCLLVLAASFEIIKDANSIKPYVLPSLLSFVYSKMEQYPEFNLSFSIIEENRLR